MKRLLILFAYCVLSTISLSAQSVAPVQDSPEAVVRQFLGLATGGELQARGGWEQANALFAHSNPMPETKVTVIMGDDYKMQELWTRGNHALIIVTYRDLGRIDSSLRYRAPDPPTSRVERRYQLVRISAPINAGKKTLETGGAEWRIQNPPRLPLIGQKAAIQYVSRMHDSAKSPVVKKNAEATIRRLKTFQ